MISLEFLLRTDCFLLIPMETFIGRHFERETPGSEERCALAIALGGCLCPGYCFRAAWAVAFVLEHCLGYFSGDCRGYCPWRLSLPWL